MILRIAIGAAIVMALLAGLQTLRLAWAQNAAQDAAEDLRNAQQANDAAASVIAGLRAANALLASSAEVTPEATARAVAEVTRQRDQLAEQLRRERGERQRIYVRDQDAKSWADSAVPAAVADRLRRTADRSPGAGRDPRPGDSGSPG